jgi:hypothetical protein
MLVWAHACLAWLQFLRGAAEALSALLAAPAHESSREAKSAGQSPDMGPFPLMNSSHWLRRAFMQMDKVLRLRHEPDERVVRNGIHFVLEGGRAAIEIRLLTLRRNRAIGGHNFNEHDERSLGARSARMMSGRFFCALIWKPMFFERSSSRLTTVLLLALRKMTAGSSEIPLRTPRQLPSRLLHSRQTPYGASHRSERLPEYAHRRPMRPFAGS